MSHPLTIDKISSYKIPGTIGRTGARTVDSTTQSLGSHTALCVNMKALQGLQIHQWKNYEPQYFQDMWYGMAQCVEELETCHDLSIEIARCASCHHSLVQVSVRAAFLWVPCRYALLHLRQMLCLEFDNGLLINGSNATGQFFLFLSSL